MTCALAAWAVSVAYGFSVLDCALPSLEFSARLEHGGVWFRGCTATLHCALVVLGAVLLLDMFIVISLTGFTMEWAIRCALDECPVYAIAHVLLAAASMRPVHVAAAGGAALTVLCGVWLELASHAQRRMISRRGGLRRT